MHRLWSRAEKDARILAALIPDSRLVLIDDGHLFLVTSAAESARMVSEFLSITRRQPAGYQTVGLLSSAVLTLRSFPTHARQSMDALSEVLKTIRLTGAAFFESQLKAPWAIGAPSSGAIAEALMPEADHVVPYHLVTSGRCVVKLIELTDTGVPSTGSIRRS